MTSCVGEHFCFYQLSHTAVKYKHQVQNNYTEKNIFDYIETILTNNYIEKQGGRDHTYIHHSVIVAHFSENH